MLRTIDRYILRETLPMVFLALLVFTFTLMIPPIMDQAQDLLTKGVDGWTVAHLMVLLVPQGLSVTIPMALLIGLLMGLGRLSGDRETVALQACGISIIRLYRPIALLALLATVATGYTMIVLLPDANQAWRDIVFRTLAARAEDEVKPRVFDSGLPGLVLYVRDVDLQGTDWTDVFLADSRGEGPPIIYVAQEGRIVLDPEERVVDIVLSAGATHRVTADDPSAYSVSRFDSSVLKLDPDTIFTEGGPQRGEREMTIPELQALVASIRASGASPHNPLMEIHQRFSIPVACLVFSIIGLGLGATSRKDGKLASFAMGIGVIFAYYILMYGARAMAKGALVSPHLAMWLPDIVLGAGGIGLLAWRVRSVDRWIALRFPWPWRQERPVPDAALPAPAPATVTTIPWAGLGVVRLLDRYVTAQYLRLITLSFVGLLGIFYIVTFVDLSDKLFKGQASILMLLEYFWYATPQYVYYVLPISALVATLITIGLLTRSSELTVMKACGISLYRASFPLLLCSLVWSGVLFGMGESFLAGANRRAESLRDVINGDRTPRTQNILDREWLMAPDGTIYHYRYFDANAQALEGLSTFHFDEQAWRVTERSYAARVVFDEGWQGEDTWSRRFADESTPGAFETSSHRELAIEPPRYFAAEQPLADEMSYQELKRYITSLSVSGVDVVSLRVSLQRKLSFPFVTLILTLIAVPFAVTTGRRGALYGVGIGIVLAAAYWVVISVFAAIGSAGLLAPVLAAWAPNVLFGGSAVFLLLAVRT